MSKPRRLIKTFLCRVSREGPHLLHVHDQPSYYSDVLRHQEMGWEMSDTCQLPDEPWTDGNPAPKPFQVINLMQTGEPSHSFDAAFYPGFGYTKFCRVCERSRSEHTDDHHRPLTKSLNVEFLLHGKSVLNYGGSPYPPIYPTDRSISNG